MGIIQNLAQILAAQYGKDVRQAIHDGIEECYDDVSTARTLATNATNSANTAATLANEKATLANTKATLADTKAGLADAAAINANTKATLANTKAGLADTAATNANTKAALAQSAADAAYASVAAGFNPRGVYNPYAVPPYSMSDLVYDNGGSYRYMHQTPSNAPTSSTLHWQQIASIGGQDVVDAAVAARNAAQGYKDAAALSASSAASSAARLACPIVCFTFDDGTLYDETTYEVMKAEGLTACFGLITESLYSNGKTSLNKYRQYQDEGFEILSHSSTHLSMGYDTYSDTIVDFEYRQSAEKLRGMGFPANGLIVPYSGAKAADYAIARKYYDFILEGSVTGLNGKGDYNDKLLGRVSAYTLGVEGVLSKIDEAIAADKLLIFYDHGVGNSGSLSQSDWETIAAYAKSKVDAGLILNCTVSDAVQRYYGQSFSDKSRNMGGANYAVPFSDASWEFTDVDSIGAASAVANEKREIYFPASLAGKSVTIKNSIPLSDTFASLGERIDVRFGVIGSNSQASNFDGELLVSLLDSSDTVLSSEAFDAGLIILSSPYSNNVHAKMYLDANKNIASVAKVEVKITLTTNDTTTVQQTISLTDLRVLCPNATNMEQKRCMFNVDRAGAIAVANNAFTKIAYNRVYSNIGRNFNASTGTFTAPSKGIYQFNASAWYTNSVDAARNRISLYKNDAIFVTNFSIFPGVSGGGVSISSVLDLIAGDTVDVYVYQESGVELTMGSGTSLFSGCRIG